MKHISRNRTQVGELKLNVSPAMEGTEGERVRAIRTARPVAIGPDVTHRDRTTHVYFLAEGEDAASQIQCSESGIVHRYSRCDFDLDL